MCLKKAGIMHNHFPSDSADASDPSPVLSRMAAAGMHPYARSLERGLLQTYAALFGKAHHLRLCTMAE